MTGQVGLNDLDAVVLARADAAVDRLEAVLDRAITLMSTSVRREGVLGHLPEYGAIARWQHLHYPDPCWAMREGGLAELFAWPHDAWIAEPRRLPVLSAGFTFAAADEPPVLSPARASWRDELTIERIHVGIEAGAVRCSRLLYLGELVARSGDCEQQAAALARWAEQSLDAIAALAPPASP